MLHSPRYRRCAWNRPLSRKDLVFDTTRRVLTGHGRAADGLSEAAGNDRNHRINIPAMRAPELIKNATTLSGIPAAKSKPGMKGPRIAPPRPTPSTRPDPEPRREEGKDAANKP